MKKLSNADCSNCFNKLFCTVNGTHCCSKNMELTWKASKKYVAKGRMGVEELIKEYKHIDSKRNCSVSYSPIKGLYE